MNVQTMQMDPRIASIHYKDYRKKVREHRTARLAEAEKKIQEGGKTFREGRHLRSVIEKEDEVLMASYRAMARGERILNMRQVMQAAGIDSDRNSRLPKLAIGRADWPHTYIRQNHGHVLFYKEAWVPYNYRTNAFHSDAVAFSQEIFPAELIDSVWRKQQGLPEVFNRRALTPAIPAHLRPAGNLGGFHILWEARWEHQAPPDPLLLKHVAGHIYTVLAQWDLTDLEKAVLEGRLA